MIETVATRPTDKSQALFKAAARVMPGGASWPARGFPGAGDVPRFMARSSGALLTDVDGNEYIDYVCGWGPLILGHADERVEAAVCKAAAKGWLFGAPTELEAQLAELVISRYPSIEMLRLVTTGAEATTNAVRLARSFTGRGRIIVCDGCCHHQAGPVLADGDQKATADTLVTPYNDTEAAARIMEAQGSEVAALLIEPIASRMGLVLPKEGYLQSLRELCDRAGALLIFDELTTGFRVSPGGVQGWCPVQPDLTCLGGILGGGLPLAALGGRKEVMELMGSVESAYQADCQAGNPLAMAAGMATLQALAEPGVYERLEQGGAQLAEGLAAAAGRAGVPIFQARLGSMGCLFFSPSPVTDYATAKRCDAKAHLQFFRAMLERGVYVAPSQRGCYFVSTAHEPEHIQRTVEAAVGAFATIAAEALET